MANAMPQTALRADLLFYFVLTLVAGNDNTE